MANKFEINSEIPLNEVFSNFKRSQILIHIHLGDFTQPFSFTSHVSVQDTEMTSNKQIDKL